MTLNFRQVRAFVAVYEEGSFNRAAKRENATQSGMSTQVANLEERVGLQLFERTDMESLTHVQTPRSSNAQWADTWAVTHIAKTGDVWSFG